MECNTSTSVSRNINDDTHGYFYPTRGIRQGGPLSPNIFILCREPLIRQLNELALTPKAHVGLLTSPFGYKISNLVFVDDCLLFAKASMKGARNILVILNSFAKAFSQKINFHTSSPYFSSNTTNHLRNEIVNIIQFNIELQLKIH